MTPSRPSRRLPLVLAVAGAVLLASVAPVWGSIFGEENTTLVQMLVQLFQIQREMSDLNKAAGQVADATNGLLATYQQVNAGLNTLKGYSFDSFVNDLSTDLYRQYPGFAKLPYASHSLGAWENTRVSSPATAYQAITAVVGDVSAPLRRDLEAGRQNLDRELLLKAEAAGGFAAAHTAEQVTEKFDKQIAALTNLAQNANPAQAAQLSARASLMIAAQQGYELRLLSRAVRLHSVDAALEYGNRLDARNAGYEARDVTVQLSAQAAQRTPLIDFTLDAEPPQPIDPYAHDTKGPLDPYASPTGTAVLDPYAGGQQ